MGKRKLNWRAFLTSGERKILSDADKAKRAWERLNAARPRIVNRAIQRAKYANRANGENNVE